MRVVILAHGHPELRAGGAERAAYSVFSELKKTEELDPVFVATSPAASIGHDGAFGAFRGRRDEYLWAPPPTEPFKLSSLQYDLLHEQCEQLLDMLRPDVVHVHHYVHTGVELFPILRSLSHARLILTLHEFILICNNYGQMVRKPTGKLCYATSPAECSTCFPENSSGKFFLRERFIKHCLVPIDHFISPSKFLRERFVQWGLAPERIRVIENPLPAEIAAFDARPIESRSGGRLRLGYFGQLTPFKGAPLLVSALGKLSEEDQQRVELVIFGGNPEDWPDVRAQIMELAEKSTVKVSFFGSYRNEDVVELMRGVDWIVVPSTWWENSPVVIQEAHAAGVPVLAANIGGMREKVLEEITGRHFLAGSDLDLARKIEAILAEPGREWPRLDVVERNRHIIDHHVLLYSGVRKAISVLSEKTSVGSG